MTWLMWIPIATGSWLSHRKKGFDVQVKSLLFLEVDKLVCTFCLYFLIKFNLVRWECHCFKFLLINNMRPNLLRFGGWALLTLKRQPLSLKACELANFGGKHARRDVDNEVVHHDVIMTESHSPLQWETVWRHRPGSLMKHLLEIPTQEQAFIVLKSIEKRIISLCVSLPFLKTEVKRWRIVFNLSSCLCCWMITATA